MTTILATLYTFNIGKTILALTGLGLATLLLTAISNYFQRRTLRRHMNFLSDEAALEGFDNLHRKIQKLQHIRRNAIRARQDLPWPAAFRMCPSDIRLLAQIVEEKAARLIDASIRG